MGKSNARLSSRKEALVRRIQALLRIDREGHGSSIGHKSMELLDLHRDARRDCSPDEVELNYSGPTLDRIRCGGHPLCNGGSVLFALGWPDKGLQEIE